MQRELSKECGKQVVEDSLEAWVQYLISLLEKCKDLLTSSQEEEESEADESEVLEAKLISEISVKLFS